MQLRRLIIPALILGAIAISGCTLNRQNRVNRVENQQQTLRYETYDEKLWREHRERDGTRILSETGKADRYSAAYIYCGVDNLREEIADGVYQLNWERHSDCVNRTLARLQR